MSWLLIIPLLLNLFFGLGGQIPTHSELLAFLEVDKTDEIRRSDSFTCSDYAKNLYYNAQAERLRMGIVLILYPTGTGHALNVFCTRDNGLIFVDCSGGHDAIAQIKVGMPYSTSYERGNFAAGTVGLLVVDYRIVWNIDQYYDAWREMAAVNPIPNNQPTKYPNRIESCR